MKTKEVLSLLKEKLLTAGLSEEQADEYVWFTQRWNRIDIKLGAIKEKDILPSDECFRTLAEAQRIVLASAMNKTNPRELHVTEIQRFLCIPDAQWKEAKCTIAKFFNKSESAVDLIYDTDEGWLLKTAEECLDAAFYVNYLCQGDERVAWKLYGYAGLIGREKLEKNTEAIFELLGPEDSFKLIKTDVFSGNWLFNRYDLANPRRCVTYLKQCGLSNAQILELLSNEGYILLLFNSTKALPKVDQIIRKFIYDWCGKYGPSHEGLTLEQIDFLIHGPSKHEWY